MSFQGLMNGGQVRDLFIRYNALALNTGVIDMTRMYNKGDKYSNSLATGNQIDLAFKEINAHEGTTLLTVGHSDYADGGKLREQLEILDKQIKESVNVIGPELIPTGTFATQSDFNAWTVNGSTHTYTYNETEGSITRAVTDGAAIDNTFTIPVVLEIGATYKFTADVSEYTANPRYWINGDIDLTVLLGEPLTFVATLDNQNVGIGYGWSRFTSSRISLRKITP